MAASSKAQKLAIAGTATLLAEPAMALAHAGGVGVIAGLMVGGLAYVFSDDIAQMTGGKKVVAEDAVSSPVSKMPNQDNVKSAMYRLIVGKSERGDYEQARTHDPGVFVFSELLASGWRPSLNQIFLARLENGQDIFIPAKALIHIALAGSTRQGKTSIIRQLLLQLAYVGCECVLMDPHYTPYDIETKEDWTPFLPFLGEDPHVYRDYRNIEEDIKNTATTLLTLRKERRAKSKPVGKPLFIFIDEYPAILAERPNVQEYVSRLLREGAKYNLFLCIASQDFQVKTTSPKAGGAIRENYKTCFYVGGDVTTANVLLDTNIDKKVEAKLGKGPVMLRSETCKEAALAQTPFTDNDALYQLLGSSTFVPGTEEEDVSLSPQINTRNRAQNVGESGESETGEMLVKESQKPGETHNDVGETFTISHEDEVAVLNAAFQVQQSGVAVTREAIKQRLGWNNKRHDIVKFVCDKHMIAMR